MSVPNTSTTDPLNQTPLGTSTSVAALRPGAIQPPLPSINAALSAHVAARALDPKVAPCLKADGLSEEPPELDDPALIVGLSLWTAHRHPRYVAAVAARGDGSIPHAYPAVLADTLHRHAEAGDPTCRLVLDWLLAKGLVEPDAPRRSDEGAV